MKPPVQRHSGIIKTCLAALTLVSAIFGAAPQGRSQEIEEPEPEIPVPITSPGNVRLLGMESLRLAVKGDGGVPLPPELNEYVRDRKAAIQLGKALFWDMQVGSDGMQSCATCHFHAGADSRAKGQLNPGLLRIRNQRQGDVEGYAAAANIPDLGFEVGGPNYSLTPADFPFVKSPNKWVENPDGTVGPWPGNSHDVTADAGVFFSHFRGITAGQNVDLGRAMYDPVWNVAGTTTRRAEPRNAPSVINAVFNFTNFWDGRANHHFNGVNPFGPQDLEARIFVSSGLTRELEQQMISLHNASLASQAVGPPLSFFEMAFGNGAENFRIFPELGRKLLSLNPLAKQNVSPTDSVLGELCNPAGPGLDPQKFRNSSNGPVINGYRYLIEKAFRPKYWNSQHRVVLPAPSQTEAPGNQTIIQDGPALLASPSSAGSMSFSHMEANMAFFFGVSVMLYEATLVSDRTPFDQWMEGSGRSVEGFGKAEIRGLDVFVNKGKCINCHGGPELTNASVRNAQGGRNVIEPMVMAQGKALYDNGFYNISVTLTTDDPGRGGNDPFGRPLAFSRQALFKRLGIQKIPFGIEGVPFPDRNTEGVLAGIDTNGNGLVDSNERLLINRVAVDGAFKTPGLRNVELTGPYFHNGGAATLKQVVQLYNRGGNFRHFNMRDLDPDIQRLDLTAQERTDLVRFLISLTDPRVKFRSAPFDHPELFIPNGHPGDHTSITSRISVDGIEQGTDDILHLPAVGREGSPTPLGTFLDLNPQLANTGNEDPSETPLPEEDQALTQADTPLPAAP